MTTSPAQVIAGFEGFRATPYYDRNAWRVGYGSDTVTNPDGSVSRVTPTTRVTQEQAQADLARRTQESQNSVIHSIGQTAWDNLTPEAQAAATSVAYNYGSLTNLPTLRRALQSGDPQTIASAIAARAGDNNGINNTRRTAEASLVLGHPVPGADVPNASTSSSSTALAYAPPPRLDPRSVSPAYDAIAAATQGVGAPDATALYRAMGASGGATAAPAGGAAGSGSAVAHQNGIAIAPPSGGGPNPGAYGATLMPPAGAAYGSAQMPGAPAASTPPAYFDTGNGIAGTAQLPRNVTYDPATGKMVPVTPSPSAPDSGPYGGPFNRLDAAAGATSAPIPMPAGEGDLARHFNGGVDRTYVGNGASIPNPSFGGSAVPVTVETPAPGSSGTVVNGVINGKIREMAPQIGDALGQVGGAVNRLVGNQPATSLADTGYGPSSPTSTAGGISPVSMYTMLKNNHGTAMNTLAQMMGTSMADLGGSGTSASDLGAAPQEVYPIGSLGSSVSHPSSTLGTDLSYAYAPGQNGQNPNMPDSANSTMMQYLADNPPVNTAPAIRPAPMVQQLNPAYLAWERNQAAPAKVASPFAGISAAALGDSLAFDPITGLPSTLPNLSQGDAQAQMNAYGAPAAPRADPRRVAPPPKYIGVPATAPPVNAAPAAPGPSVADAPAMANWPVTAVSNGYDYARNPSTGAYTNVGQQQQYANLTPSQLYDSMNHGQSNTGNNNNPTQSLTQGNW